MGKYEERIADMRWSYSRLTSFEHCPYSFYLGYVLTKKERERLGYINEGNYYAEVGSYVHKILEMIFKKELSIDDASQYYADHFDENVFYEVAESTMEKTYEACADYFYNFNFDWLKGYEIMGVEMECKFKINGYDFIGYIDLLLRDLSDGKFVVVDHKSAQYPLRKDGKVKKSSEESFRNYKRQMYLYSYAVMDKYGEFPKQIKWNHFKVGEFVTIDFDINEYNEAVEWFTDTIGQIEKEKDFEPRLQFFFCKNLCNFRNSCDYAIRLKPWQWKDIK